MQWLETAVRFTEFVLRVVVNTIVAYYILYPVVTIVRFFSLISE